MRKKEKRFNFWGKRIKVKPELEKEEKEPREKRGIDFSFLWLILAIVGALIFILIVISVISEIDILPSIEGTYTIKIYVPDCDNGQLIFEEHNVSGQYLYDNNLAERKNLLGDELKPVSNYQRWEKYVYEKTGNYIPDDNCCIVLIKE